MRTDVSHKPLIPRDFEHVGHGTTVRDGVRVTLTVSAMRVPGGYLVRTFEVTRIETCSSVLGIAPAPGTYSSTFTLPVITIDEVRRAMFEPPPVQNSREGIVSDISVDGEPPFRVSHPRSGCVFMVRHCVTVSVDGPGYATVLHASLKRGDKRTAVWADKRVLATDVRVDLTVDVPRLDSEDRDQAIACYVAAIGFDDSVRAILNADERAER